MKYIKHDWKFYQELDLDKLTKKELVKLIATCVEVKDHTVYVNRYPWWNTSPFYYASGTVTLNSSDTTLTTASTNGGTVINAVHSELDTSPMDQAWIAMRSWLSIVEPNLDEIPKNDLLEIARSSLS